MARQKSNPAKYRHRLTFQKREKVKDDEGNTVIDWVDQFTVWGSIKGLRGRDYLIAGAEAVKISTRIYIRYRKGVTSDMRITFNDGGTVRFFDMINPTNVNDANEELEILANEVDLNA